MDRRRLLLVAVVIVAGLLLVARCGQADDDTAQELSGVDGVSAPTGASGARADAITSAPPLASVPAADPHAPLESAAADPTPPASQPAQPAAVAAAEEFARQWVDADAEWSDRLSALATAQLAASLAGVDPDTVPAAAVTGPGSVVSEVPGWVSVAVPTDAGTVVLHVVQAGDDWLVSVIDWRPRW